MPYRHAHYFVGFVFLVILTGFWASYWAPIATVPAAFHVHAISALLWLSLLIIQSISIHRRANALHKQLGLASLVLFPFLILGLVMIVDVAARRFNAAESPAALHLSPSFGIGTAIAIAAYLTLFYQALKMRRNIKLHAGYMLATPVILFESPFSRVMGDFLPWMNVIDSPMPQAVLDTIALSNAISLIFAMAMYLGNRKHGAPWLVAAGFVALQAVVMWFAPFFSPLTTLFGIYAQIPFAVTAACGITAGALAGWLGWRAGATPQRAAVPAQA